MPGSLGEQLPQYQAPPGDELQLVMVALGDDGELVGES